MKAKHAVLTLVLSLLTALPALAHHSFAAEFDQSKSLTLTGTVSKVEWTNPHVYFYIDVKDDKGNIVTWGFEGGNPGQLTRGGWTRNSLKIGDQVTVEGFAAKDGAHLVGTRRVTLADGRRVLGAAGAPDADAPGGANGPGAANKDQ